MKQFIDPFKEQIKKLVETIAQSGGYEKVRDKIKQVDLKLPAIKTDEQAMLKQLKNLQGDQLMVFLEKLNTQIKQDYAIEPILEAFKDTHLLTKESQTEQMIVFKVMRKKQGTLFAYLFILQEGSESCLEAFKTARSENQAWASIEAIIVDLSTLTFIQGIEETVSINKDLTVSKTAFEEANTFELRTIEMAYRVRPEKEPEEEVAANDAQQSEDAAEAAE